MKDIDSILAQISDEIKKLMDSHMGLLMYVQIFDVRVNGVKILADDLTQFLPKYVTDPEFEPEETLQRMFDDPEYELTINNNDSDRN